MKFTLGGSRKFAGKRLDLAPCAQAPSDRGGAACSPQESSSLPAGGPREGVGVGDVDAAALHLDTPAPHSFENARMTASLLDPIMENPD